MSSLVVAVNVTAVQTPKPALDTRQRRQLMPMDTGPSPLLAHVPKMMLLS